MDKCHYYLSNGLWKIVRAYFDYRNKGQNDYFWGMAVLPNYNSFASHIISTPWQQSWATMNILEAVQEYIDEEGIGNEAFCASELNILRKEVNFQYMMRNYSSQSFVQQLFTTNSRIQTHLLVNFTEAETKSFISRLKTLLNMLLQESPSSAHSLLQYMFKYGFFFSNFLDSILNDISADGAFCSLILQGLCLSETVEIHLSFIIALSRSSMRYQLCLLLVASDNMALLRSVIEEDKKLFNNESVNILNRFFEASWEPLKMFKYMVTTERHFLLLLLELIQQHMDVFRKSNHQNIPSFIWPLILLQSWNDENIPVDVLLLFIEKCKESSKDRIILQIAFILEWCINFSNWYEKHSINEARIIDKKSDLLEKAKEYSVLYLINNSTDLSETDWNQILELLKQGKSRSDVIKSWDIILFDGYRIIIYLFHIIFISSEIYNFSKLQKPKMQEIHILNEIFSSLYLEEVTGKLKLIKHMIKTMYPLNFRLEILENIFSMLFLQFEDIKKLSFLNKVGDNIMKNMISKTKSMEKTITLKLGKNFNLTHYQHSVKPEDEETSKKSRMKGFVCKKFIIRDIIYLVKDCLIKLEEDFKSQSDVAAFNLPCSIKESQMENRLDRLSESVNEATWRLQLVTDPDFISQTGVMHYPCGQDPFHHYDNEWIFLLNDNDKSASFKVRKKSAEKANDSGSQSQSSASNGNSGGELQPMKNKISCRAIMNQMLASDSSLVIQCLAQGDVLNANHIIQTLSAEENKQTLEGELQFTESVNDLKKKLQNISLESPVRKFNVEGGLAKSYSLQSIQMVANQGVTSTALPNHIERFLSVSTLPSIQGASKVSVGSMLQCIENAQAIVTIDLALTTEMTFQDFKGLLNIASKHCPELSTRVQSPISPQALFSKPLGYIIFSQNIIALLQEVNKNQALESATEISLSEFLRSDQFPFSLKSLKESLNFWKSLKLVVSDFEKGDSENIAQENNKEVSISKHQKNIKEMQKVFENVKKLVESCGEFMNLGKMDSSSGEITKSVNYSDLLSRYLTDLASFILENIPSMSDIFEPVSFSGLLEQSAVDIVDRLIFTYGVEPTALEKKAQQLGFNLSASLVAGCCPRLPQNNFCGDSSKCPPSERIVLNELVPDYKATDLINPVEVIENIFSELLIAFENYSHNKIVDADITEGSRNIFSEVDIIELRNDFKIQRILEKTLQLNFVNFESLSNCDLLVLFLNLLNLMLCHCYLSTKLDRTDGVYSNYFLNRHVGYVFLGYNVGDLGFISINDLKTLLLGENAQSIFSVQPYDWWTRFKIAPDPRIIFAVHDFRSVSPYLQFYSMNNMESQLKKTISSYLESFVCLKDRRLVISDLLEWYLDNVLEYQELKNHGRDWGGSIRVKSLIKFMNDYVSDEFRQLLKDVETSDIVLQVHHGSPGLSLILENDKNSYTENNVLDKSLEKWMDRSLSDSILRHLSQSSRVLADIVQKIHEAKELVPTEVARDVLTEEKLKYLDLLLSAPWHYHISPLFDNNPVITALSKTPSANQLNNFFQDAIRKKDWFKCWTVLFALPDYFMMSNLNLKRLKDIVLREITFLASERNEEHPWYYSQHIVDINIRQETVKSCLRYWSGSICISQLSSILCDYPDLRKDMLDEIRSLIRKIRVYNTICKTVPEYSGKSWYDVYTSVSTSPHILLHNLIKASQLELCLQWINLPGILNSIQQYIDSDFMLLFFNLLPDNFELIDQLLNSLPLETLSHLCDSVIYKLKSVPLISHFVQLLLRINPLPQYETIAFGVKMIFDLSVEEQSELVHLISHPLLIIEQLLMNMRLDALENVLKKVREETDGKLINQAEVNDLIVSYASKSVEFDFIKNVKNTDFKQSFMLEARMETQSELTVPAEVPDKSQWIPDNQVSLCMCCLLVSFSMFNRRHHCRRCGRVVCSTCSPYQLKVAGYKGVAVRVCRVCYNYHMKVEGDSKSLPATEMFSGFTFSQELRHWTLSIDPSRNATIRDEFSYEYIPNVSLCLAIFNLLPDVTYSSVLLDESDKMLRMLQLNGKAGNPEVDCGVVIQIIRSLIIGAKVKYGQASLSTGVVCCDRLLSQVDLLHLLIKNHYSRLIPSEPLDGHTLRCLRDKLVEEELWDLAIEVSTKSGLDRNGVWASWGKVCLTAGSWEEARVKFSYCLDSKSKPVRNPPLVDEICRILESSSSVVGFKQNLIKHDKNDTAQEVTQILSSLKYIAQGKGLLLSGGSAKNTIQYNEQIYYLSTYGSHQALMSFYLKYDEWKSALGYMLEQQLEPEMFVETILLPSYKNEQQNRLNSEMLAMDSSLEDFKRYLSHACLFLQKCDHLHILYEVQLLMQDFVRAAATCIRLYKRYASSYAELIGRVTYLHKALRHLEEEITALNKKTKRLDCILKLEPKEINKHMKTIWRQLEVSKFLGKYEAEGKPFQTFFPECVFKGNEIVTLFDGTSERVILASWVILSGKNIAEGFGLAYRIIQDYQLEPKEIYMTVGKKLAETQRSNDIEALIDCMKTSGAEDVSATISEVLSTSLPLLNTSGDVDDLVKLTKHIGNVDVKISVLIDLRQLKSAYLLAVRHNRLKEVQRIMEVADQTGQTVIKKICMKKLGQSPEGSICSSVPSCDDT